MSNHPEDYVPQLSESKVRRNFRRVKAGKAAGLDGVPPCIFNICMDQLAPVSLLKLRDLGLGTPICNWIMDFLTDRPQVVMIGSNTSSTLVLNTGAPQGCCLNRSLRFRFRFRFYNCFLNVHTFRKREMLVFLGSSTIVDSQ